jgi:YD repeat-containing protein
MKLPTLLALVPLVAACGEDGEPRRHLEAPLAPPFTACAADEDVDNDGTRDAVTDYRYDVDGFSIVARFDAGADGTLDSEARVRLRPDGQTELYEYWRPFDGTLTLVMRQTRSYDEGGLVTAIETDRDGDGTVDHTRTFVNEDGRPVEEHADGFVRHHVYDAEGRLARIDVDDGERVVEAVEIYFYDSLGQLARQEVDADRDGSYDVFYDYAYDDFGYRSRELGEERGGEGSIFWDMTWVNSADRVLRFRVESGREGEPVQTSITSYRYDCSEG